LSRAERSWYTSVEFFCEQAEVAVDETVWKWAASTAQVVGGAVGGWWLKELSERLKVRRETLPYIPKQTVRIVELPKGKFLWRHAEDTNKVGMFIFAHFSVTNVTTRPVLLTSALLTNPKTTADIDLQSVGPSSKQSNFNDPNYDPRQDTNIPGQHQIPPLETMQGRARFWVPPPLLPYGRNFRTSLAVIDRFGNKHWIKNVEVRYDPCTIPIQHPAEVLPDTAPGKNTWGSKGHLWGKRIHLHGWFKIKNTVLFKLFLVAAKLRSSGETGAVLVEAPTTKQYGMHSINPNEELVGKYAIPLNGSKVKKGKPFQGEIVLVDHMDYEHSLGNVTFTPS
jgi:hypothetical protein